MKNMNKTQLLRLIDAIDAEALRLGDKIHTAYWIRLANTKRQALKTLQEML